MDDILTFLRANWAFISPPLLLLMSGAGWLINRRVTRAARRLDEAAKKADTLGDTVTALAESLDAVRSELNELWARIGILRQAIKETVPDKGAAVFRREQELLEQRSQRQK